MAHAMPISSLTNKVSIHGCREIQSEYGCTRAHGSSANSAQGGRHLFSSWKSVQIGSCASTHKNHGHYYYCCQTRKERHSGSVKGVALLSTLQAAYVKRHDDDGRRGTRTSPRICAAATTSPSASVKDTSADTTQASLAPPYNILITGSTKGIGYALACRFLEAGDNVVICSRSEERVAAVEKELREKFGKERVWGTTCDVSKAASVKALASFATQQCGRIDLWINNAGSNAYSYKPLVESDDTDIEEVVQTNTLGVMLCCRQAIRVMREQPTGGHIFNMDGAGADGNATPRFAAYGATKRSLTQFTKSLQAELKMLDIKNVIVHNLSPGMVTTELLMAGATTRTAKFFINALAEPADTVAEYLVPRVREVPTSCGGNSTYIRFLTSVKAYSQIITRIIFKARKDRYVLED